MKLDKILHAIVCFLLTLGIYFFTLNLILAVVITLAIGLAKELYDINYTGFNQEDIVADLVGIAIASLLIIIF